MTERLSKEREADIREIHFTTGETDYCAAIDELLAELDAVRAELGFARDRVRILTNRLNARDDAYDAAIEEPVIVLNRRISPLLDPDIGGPGTWSVTNPDGSETHCSLQGALDVVLGTKYWLEDDPEPRGPSLAAMLEKAREEGRLEERRLWEDNSKPQREHSK